MQRRCPVRFVTLLAASIAFIGYSAAQVSLGPPLRIAGSSFGASFPQGITYHAARNTLFVLDENGRVSEINRSGGLVSSFRTPVVGGGGIAYDPTDGNLILIQGSLLRRVSPNGTGLSVLANLSPEILSVEGVAVHPVTGRFWVSDDNIEQVFELDRQGNTVSKFFTRSVLPGLLEPAGLAFLGNDLLLTDDADATASLYLVSTTGRLLQQVAKLSAFGIADPEGVATVGADEIWVAADNDDALLKFSLNQDFELYFAQFGDGQGLLSSEVLLVNLDSAPATAQVLLSNDQGQPLTVDLNGIPVNGQTQVVVPVNGMVRLSSDGIGPLTSGSVLVRSNRLLSGAVIFGGAVGTAGVGASLPNAGFVAPVENSAAESIRVGIALMNLENRTLNIGLKLLDEQGFVVAQLANLPLPAGGRRSRFLDELFTTANLNSFQGVLEASADGRMAATVIQTRPDEFVTLPVTPLGEGRRDLYFAQFGDGEGLLFSQLMLVNLDQGLDASAQIRLRNALGQPLSVDLNGGPVSGDLGTIAPAGGLRVLRTDGLGPLTSGSAIVSADRSMSGVILFGGSVGVAGVGASPVFASGFLAPMVNDAAQGIRVGVAVMNLESFGQSAVFRLYNANGTLRGQVSGVALPAGGRSARFLDELFQNLDLSDFEGVLEVSAGGKLAAIALQTRPGQFATLPVAARR